MKGTYVLGIKEGQGGEFKAVGEGGSMEEERLGDQPLRNSN